MAVGAKLNQSMSVYVNLDCIADCTHVLTVL